MGEEPIRAENGDGVGGEVRSFLSPQTECFRCWSKELCNRQGDVVSWGTQPGKCRRYGKKLADGEVVTREDIALSGTSAFRTGYDTFGYIAHVHEVLAAPHTNGQRTLAESSEHLAHISSGEVSGTDNTRGMDNTGV